MNENNKKFDDFKEALKQLCIEHKVDLGVSINEKLFADDLVDGEYMTDIEMMEDWTNGNDKHPS